MLSNIKALLSKHFSQHITLYFIIILCFSIGIASGAFCVKALSETQKGQLVDYLVSTFKTLVEGGAINNTQIFWSSLVNSLKTVFVIWVLSLLMFTFPFILIVIGIRGFVLGFTIGFLVENLGYRGILFSVVSILPQNIIIIPMLIIFSAISISYSIESLKRRKLKRYGKNNNLKYFFGYSIESAVLLFLLMFGSLIEAYASPVFLKGIYRYLIN